MATKINPISFRLGLNKNWSSRWFFKKNLRFFIEEDYFIREFIKNKILTAGIDAIEIERTGEQIKISIRASRPGLIIGRGGKGIEELKNSLLKQLRRLRQKNNKPEDIVLNLNVEELNRTEVSAPVMAQQIAFELEKRLRYRSVMKKFLSNIMQYRGVQGAKIRMSGRLNGATISRYDWLAKGQMPLSTLRANIDYGEATAFNSYGTVGVKVWIYKGEVFNEKIESRK
ncbi:30S ribosomal protein S3 [Candidatus Jorgensenbacteria bacterium CG_4_10_14_0_8_um_filter_39_13]|uniref:Small ribosomal subunit protein uS3 n=2 Tax=Candidatus Joergenseniibacteriota TaxID=1752739 RepID=A0A2M7RH04_9BACT|nr:MAG: 30S ribosomal protein S3 [Candidatus Jorgensenbacteria bacterium CG11_big_fil_rev_8_21_14_0_20_38_23]PIV13202.1 MAG: 30S ribosomal protein S3 [Candidatus Jorgensenbacteria bacterium CG03_land_8_20_14_0_80_38_39]PIY96039.1 MAG: 30S ribosomal protein S3 [Candidatus Jorgensenbacteria bacterium CG_4_10_14_0_8_um_filter_39_13]